MTALDFPQEFPVLNTERLLLRQMSMDDAPRILALRSDEQVMRYLGRRKMQTLDEAEQLIKGILESYNEKDAVLWGICLKDGNTLLGTVCLWNIQHDNYRAELGYILDAAHWRKGILSECLDAVLPYGFDTMHLHSLEAHVSPKNIASIKLLEKYGFVKEAYFKENFYFNGAFEDTAVYSLLGGQEYA